MYQTPFATPEGFKEYLLEETKIEDQLVFCIIDNKNKHPLGVLAYKANCPEHLTIEIGGF